MKGSISNLGLVVICGAFSMTGLFAENVEQVSSQFTFSREEKSPKAESTQEEGSFVEGNAEVVVKEEALVEVVPAEKTEGVEEPVAEEAAPEEEAPAEEVEVVEAVVEEVEQVEPQEKEAVTKEPEIVVEEVAEEEPVQESVVDEQKQAVVVEEVSEPVIEEQEVTTEVVEEVVEQIAFVPPRGFYDFVELHLDLISLTAKKKYSQEELEKIFTYLVQTACHSENENNLLPLLVAAYGYKDGRIDAADACGADLANFLEENPMIIGSLEASCMVLALGTNPDCSYEEHCNKVKECAEALNSLLKLMGIEMDCTEELYKQLTYQVEG